MSRFLPLSILLLMHQLLIGFDLKNDDSNAELNITLKFDGYKIIGTISVYPSLDLINVKMNVAAVEYLVILVF